MFSNYAKHYTTATDIKWEVIYALQECRDRCLLHSGKMYVSNSIGFL